jgi:hypothetical protein
MPDRVCACCRSAIAPIYILVAGYGQTPASALVVDRSTAMSVFMVFLSLLVKASICWKSAVGMTVPAT